MVTFQEAFAQAESEAEGFDSLEDGPASNGQAEDEGQVGESSTEQSYFDLDQYGDQLVKIKVDGVEQTVPLKELQQGYQRQADYTRKTQELAAERQRLQAAETLAAAYERNPVETVRFLAQQQGITLAEAQAQADAAVAEREDWSNSQEVDPRIAAIEARLRELDEREARAELDRTLANLGAKYGDDFNPDEVVSAAIALQTTDLEGVYKQIAFDRMLARQQAAAQAAQAKVAEDQKAVQGKRELSQTVATGGSFAGAGAGTPQPIKSVAAALEAALAEHDFDF